MNVDEAVIILLVSQGVGSIVMLLLSKYVLRREAESILGNALETVFGQPAVKGAMSVLGQKSGAVRHERVEIEKMAKDILAGPQLGGLKMAGKAIGLDLDEYIEENGAVDTLRNLQSLGSAIGIDFMNLDLGALISQGSNTSGGSTTATNNPYLK